MTPKPKTPTASGISRLLAAAPAAATRGAQPAGQRTITICQLCRKRVYKQVNGAWYHRYNGSEFCRPGDGTGRKAVPLTIEASR